MDSKALLAQQYRSHAGLLTELLASPGGVPVPAPMLERSLRGTHMLGGSAAVMGLRYWAELCEAFQRLLVHYRDRQFPWDDRIADVTSEMIEKMEAVAEACATTNLSALDSVVPADEMSALSAELRVLDEECRAVPEVDAPPAVEPAVTVELDAAPAAAPAPGAAPLPGVVAELRGSFQRLEALLETDAWKSRSWDSPDVNSLRRELNTIDFCARAMEKVIGDKLESPATSQRTPLTPLRVVLRDFAAELAHGTGRTVTVELCGDELTVDPRLLATTTLVLQSMIKDAFSRSAAAAMRMEIAARDASGALRWTVRDNGGNFISDAPIDHEDHLAYYTGLRGVLNMIGRHRSVLWVEPGSTSEDMRARFEFTLPVSDTADALVTWGSGPDAFALRATQVCATVDAATASIREDEYGRSVEIGGGRVALFQLDELYRSGPGRGDTVVVIGALEKRIAFYVRGGGERIDGHVLGGAVPPWEGAPPYVAQVGSRRVSLLDADYVVSAYHSITGAMSTEQISGGVPEDAPEITPCPGPSMVDVPAPPGDTGVGDGESGLDVLIVEQSESMRESLESILTSRKISARCASEVDEAMTLVRSLSPRVVISEFRMPTMAAKRIVDRLHESGRSVPVLVTTSQDGDTANLLVEKLGAAGYLSKPLDADEVVERVSAHLTEGAPR